MNEVKKCSLSGLSFTMTAGAYELLENYLDSLKSRYGSQPEGEEIMADIEARIAELILSEQDNTRVVERPLVAGITERLGSAEDIQAESDGVEQESEHEQKQGQTQEQAQTHPEETGIPRRLFRDPANARLGGVCSGIAHYFGSDPSVIRLAAASPLLLTILSTLPLPFTGSWLASMGGSLQGAVIIAYLVMWFAVPAAKTPRQKLEMNGETITLRSIRENAGRRDAESKARSAVAETVTIAGRALTIAIKLLAMLAVAGLTAFAVALVIAMLAVGLTHAQLPEGTGIPDAVATIFRDSALPLLGISLCLVLVIFILYMLICMIAGRRINRTAAVVMLLLWVANLIAIPVTALVRAGSTGMSLCVSCEEKEYAAEGDEAVEVDEANEAVEFDEAVETDEADEVVETVGAVEE